MGTRQAVGPCSREPDRQAISERRHERVSPPFTNPSITRLRNVPFLTGKGDAMPAKVWTRFILERSMEVYYVPLQQTHSLHDGFSVF